MRDSNLSLKATLLSAVALPAFIFAGSYFLSAARLTRSRNDHPLCYYNKLPYSQNAVVRMSDGIAKRCRDGAWVDPRTRSDNQ